MSEELRRNMVVELTSPGYLGKQGYLSAPARTEHDGTLCWYVILKGTFTPLRFRVDEFKVVQ